MANNSQPSRLKTRSPVIQTVKPPASAPVRLKTVVRRLPPNLPEAVFWQTVDPWVSEESVSWKVFYPGKLRTKPNKENVPSRAYILFRDEESLASFGRGYDGHLFRDKQGNESQAVVEFAPNQKVPPEKKKVDSRHATILQGLYEHSNRLTHLKDSYFMNPEDEDYLSFVAALQNPQPKPAEVDVEALLASTQPPEEPKTTPLLAALREQKSSTHEKKLVASEAAKTQAKKGVAAAVSGQKPDGDDAGQPVAKRGRKGKGTHHAGTSTASATPNAANNPQTKPSKPSGGSRNRHTVSAANSHDPSVSVAGGDEASQRRSRPTLGLQSRHLKAALNGAGVMMVPPTSSSGTSPASVIPPDQTATTSSGRPSGGPRGMTGRVDDGEKQNERGGKDGTAKNVVSGRGSGKERGRSRHPPVSSTAGSGRGMDATPRILSRQDPPVNALNTGELSARDRSAMGSTQDAGGGRGRGGRRGRGQS